MYRSALWDACVAQRSKNVQFTMYRSALWDACVAQRSKDV